MTCYSAPSIAEVRDTPMVDYTLQEEDMINVFGIGLIKLFHIEKLDWYKYDVILTVKLFCKECVEYKTTHKLTLPWNHGRLNF